MTYRLRITNEANWQVVKQKNVWGVAERHRDTIAKVKLGGTLDFFVRV
jgi:predicted RNA-binding protein